MNADPYEALGLDRDATPDDINAAYRRAAKDTHPDAGGSPEAFDFVSACRALLLDTKRRAQYDRSGEFGKDEPDNPLSGPVSVLSIFFDNVAQQYASTPQPIPLAQADLIGTGVRDIGEKLATLRRTRAMMESHMASLRTMAERLAPKSGPDHLVRAIRWRISKLIEQSKPLDEDIANHAGAIEMLKGYTFKADAPPPPPVYSAAPWDSPAQPVTRETIDKWKRLGEATPFFFTQR